jgi:hypothetical protein
VRLSEVVQGQRRAAGQQLAEGVRTVGAAQLVARIGGPALSQKYCSIESYFSPG